MMNGEYYLRIAKNENLMAEIRKFADRYHVCGHFTGIGAANKVIISTYIPEKHDFLDHTKEGMLEMFTLTGNVSLDDQNQPVVHAHAGFSYLNDKGDIAVIAGDLREATIGYTGEIVFTPTKEDLPRQFDPDAGIDVWKLN